MRRDPSPDPSGQRPGAEEASRRLRQAFGAVRRGLDRGIGPLKGDAVFLDEAVPALVVSTIRDATKYAVVVSPYIDLWAHAKDAIRLATNRGVEVIVVVRADPQVLKSEDLIWLTEAGVKVLAADRLHAKIYFNESTVVVSSMNLTEFSTKNSLEVALVVNGTRAADALREYVSGTLIRLAKPVGGQAAKANRRRSERPSPRSKGPRTGVCIRCKEDTDFDPTRPLCRKCYEVWVQFSNSDYVENHCHSCGRATDATYSRPQCHSCFRGS